MTASDSPYLDHVQGRTALVTGAGSGLGRAISLALATAGARVVLVGRTRETLEGVAAEITADGGQPRVAVADTASPASVEALQEELGDERVSILVNNAGVPGPVAVLQDIDPDDWDDVFAVNVRGVYLMCRAFLPPMIQRREGHIINLASVSGKRPLARRTPYTASKMAVIGLSTTLAHEVGVHGISVNTLSPGPVRGPRMERNFLLEAERTGTSPENAEKEFVSRAALGRLLEEAEVGNAVVAMLAMPGMTGADIDLSGGMVAR